MVAGREKMEGATDMVTRGRDHETDPDGVGGGVGGANFLAFCLYPFLSEGAWTGAGGGGVGVGVRYIGQGVGIRWEP